MHTYIHACIHTQTCIARSANSNNRSVCWRLGLPPLHSSPLQLWLERSQNHPGTRCPVGLRTWQT